MNYQISIGSPAHSTFQTNDILEAAGYLIALRCSAFGDYAELDGTLTNNDLDDNFQPIREHCEVFMDRRLTDDEWRTLNRYIHAAWEQIDASVIEDTPVTHTAEDAITALCCDYGWAAEVSAAQSITGQDTQRVWWRAIDPENRVNLSGPTAQSLLIQVHRVVMTRRSHDEAFSSRTMATMKRPTLRCGKYF